MDIDSMKAISIILKAMLGNNTTSSFKAKMPRTCGLKILEDFLVTDNNAGSIV
jgi:hypothetical protein